jgi:hypothetical protein
MLSVLITSGSSPGTLIRPSRELRTEFSTPSTAPKGPPEPPDRPPPLSARDARPMLPSAPTIVAPAWRLTGGAALALGRPLAAGGAAAKARTDNAEYCDTGRELASISGGSHVTG